jgi:hypothetical protein
MLDENELYRKGIVFLFEKLKPIKASRFLSVVKSKRVDSVKRHRKWQESLDKEQFFKEIIEGK